MLINITTQSFLKLFLTDFIYKPFIPLFLIFVGIIAVNIFCDDYVSGNMKFFLISKMRKSQLYIGKVVYMFLVVLMLIAANLIFGFIAGSFFFKPGTFDMNFIQDTLAVYMFSAIPALAFAIVISVVSILVNNSTTMLSVSIFLSIALTVVDQFTKSKYFSPVGTISLLGDNLIVSMKDFLITNGISLVYVILGGVIAISAFKRKDIVL